MQSTERHALHTLWIIGLTATVSLSLAAAQQGDPVGPDPEPPSATDPGVDPDPTDPQTSPPAAEPVVEETEPSAEPVAEAGPPECVVIMTDGRRVRGLLVEETETAITLRISGIDTRFRVESIVAFEILAPVEERFLAMRAMTDDSDIVGILIMAEWLRERERFDLALAQIDHVLEIDPNDPRAHEMKRLVEGQRRLHASPGRWSRDEPRFEEPRATGIDFPLLSPDQINLIKVFEVDLADPPRLFVERATVQQLLDDYEESELIPQTEEGRQAFLRLPPERILEIMFRLKARHLYGRVRVRDQPKALRRFRDNVHSSWLINGCATTSCHGGEKAGRLWLNNRKRNVDQSVYTNFLIIERFTLEDGTPLINYAEPALSPLLHMGLPRDKAVFPHPEVLVASKARGWRSVHRSTDDRGYVQAIEWIRSMYRPRPEYPIEYTPPVPTGLIDPLPETGEPIDR